MSQQTYEFGLPNEPPPIGGDVGDWVGWGYDWATGGSSGSGGASGSDGWEQFYIQEWNGTPCPGAPSVAAFTAAVVRDPQGAAYFQAKLSEANGGLAPTIQDMADASRAFLVINALMGGKDCVNSRFPSLDSELRAWVAGSSSPAWGSDPENEGGSWWGDAWGWIKENVRINSSGIPGADYPERRYLGMTGAGLIFWSALALLVVVFLVRRS